MGFKVEVRREELYFKGLISRVVRYVFEREMRAKVKIIVRKFVLENIGFIGVIIFMF